MFYVFQTNTVAYANQLMDNFYYLGGDRMPYTETAAGSLTAVDATYDLGSATYRWDDVYCDNLYVSGDITSNSNTLWILETRVELSAAAQRINVGGLDGDDAEIYRIILRTVMNDSCTASYQLMMNNDSSSNYKYQYIRGAGGAASAARNSSASFAMSVVYATTTTKQKTFTEGILYATSGKARHFLSNTQRNSAGTYIADILFYGQDWSNTSATITSMTAWASTSTGMGVGTIIEVWKRG